MRNRRRRVATGRFWNTGLEPREANLGEELRQEVPNPACRHESKIALSHEESVTLGQPSEGKPEGAGDPRRQTRSPRPRGREFSIGRTEGRPSSARFFLRILQRSVSLHLLQNATPRRTLDSWPESRNSKKVHLFAGPAGRAAVCGGSRRFSGWAGGSGRARIVGTAGAGLRGPVGGRRQFLPRFEYIWRARAFRR